MSLFTSLYRKYRSQTLAELVGQNVIVTILGNALKQQQLSHAYLLCGPRGTGKTSTARILAKAVNCQNPQGFEPCNQCILCRKITAGHCVDVIEVDAASNRGIDEIRALREQLHFQPMEAKKKIYVIDEVHMLTDAAFNALLKTLEEPPAHVLFLLATTDAHKVPPTIRSRCQQLFFRKIAATDIMTQLSQILTREGRSAEPEALQGIAEAADGGLRDALSLLDQLLAFHGATITAADVDQLLGAPPRAACAALLKDAESGDLAQAFKNLAAQLNQGRQAAEILKQWIAVYKEQLLLPDASPKAVARLEICFDVDKQLRWHENKQLLLELALAKVSGVFQESGVASQESGVRIQDSAVGEAPPGDGVLTLAEVKHAWREILADIKRIKLNTYALLIDAEPVHVDAAQIWVAYQSGQSFIKEKVSEEGNRSRVEQVLAKKLGRPLKLRAVMQGEIPAQGSREAMKTTGGNNAAEVLSPENLVAQALLQDVHGIRLVSGPGEMSTFQVDPDLYASLQSQMSHFLALDGDVELRRRDPGGALPGQNT